MFHKYIYTVYVFYYDMSVLFVTLKGCSCLQVNKGNIAYNTDVCMVLSAITRQ